MSNAMHFSIFGEYRQKITTSGAKRRRTIPQLFAFEGIVKKKMWKIATNHLQVVSHLDKNTRFEI